MTPPDPVPRSTASKIKNARGERLDYTFVAGRPGQMDVAILAHGVTSQKDRPWALDLEAALTAAGIAVMRFSFSGNGASEGRFDDATPTKEVEDLGSVLDAFAGWRVACVGHSMGGAVALLRAARDPRIAVLVSLAGMFHVEDFMRRHFGHLAPGDPMLGKPACPWNLKLEEDARRIGSLTDAASCIHVPWLLVHGTADELVPLQDSVDARAAAGGRAELVTLESADHRFTGAHEALVRAVVPWIARQLALR
ncbi:MAG TPA: alpha/beta fold hydrolase [Vicinamibacteria bacterium]|nr:alpha/beta fold hydrolase [Vicinamibacteria bacterium]